MDYFFEPFMAAQLPTSVFSHLFGIGKGSGAALLFFLLGVLGSMTCLVFRKDRNIWPLERQTKSNSRIKRVIKSRTSIKSSGNIFCCRNFCIYNSLFLFSEKCSLKSFLAIFLCRPIQILSRIIHIAYH